MAMLAIVLMLPGTLLQTGSGEGLSRSTRSKQVAIMESLLLAPLTHMDHSIPGRPHKVLWLQVREARAKLWLGDTSAS